MQTQAQRWCQENEWTAHFGAAQLSGHVQSSVQKSAAKFGRWFRRESASTICTWKRAVAWERRAAGCLWLSLRWRCGATDPDRHGRVDGKAMAPSAAACAGGRGVGHRVLRGLARLGGLVTGCQTCWFLADNTETNAAGATTCPRIEKHLVVLQLWASPNVLFFYRTVQTSSFWPPRPRFRGETFAPRWIQSTYSSFCGFV